MSYPLQVTMIGSAGVGKSWLIETFIKGECPKETIEPTFNNHSCTITVDKKEHSVTILDTSDTSGDKCRDATVPRNLPGICRNTDCFLICYSIASKKSSDEVMTKWHPEIRLLSEHAPIVLVGTQLDLRVGISEKFMTEEEGKRLKEAIGASSFVECSSTENIKVTKVFEEIIRAVVANEGNSSTCCSLM